MECCKWTQPYHSSVHMHHDNLRDLNAKLLAKIQKDVDTEPALIPILLLKKIINNAVGNGADGARLDRVVHYQHSTLTPLVYTTCGTMGRECHAFYKHLCQKLAEKRGESYADVMCWIRCKVSFLCLRNTIMSVRGSRGQKTEIAVPDDFQAEVNAMAV